MARVQHVTATTFLHVRDALSGGEGLDAEEDR